MDHPIRLKTNRQSSIRPLQPILHATIHAPERGRMRLDASIPIAKMDRQIIFSRPEGTVIKRRCAVIIIHFLMLGISHKARL